MAVIYVGLDDTDTLDTPGTNQLARHLVQQLAGQWRGQLITRHQLLVDPRVPCTRRNGCVAIAFEAVSGRSDDDLANQISTIMRAWCPAGSDPGLCVAEGEIAESVIEFGRTCQRELVTQEQARSLAERLSINLFGLGGTDDGVIGALAAIGLINTRNDGRVIYVGNSEIDHYYISGVQEIDRMRAFGVEEVRRLDSHERVAGGTVDVGKRLRPNYRAAKVVLYVSPGILEGVDWHAERVL